MDRDTKWQNLQAALTVENDFTYFIACTVKGIAI